MSKVLTLVASELAEPTPQAVAAYAAELGEAPTVAGVLFYGSSLRAQSAEGVVDLYVLVDDLRAWPGSRPIAAIAGSLLPPNVEHHLTDDLRAKVAVMRLDQFERGVRPEAIDTTLWARFAQPARLAWSRDTAARERITTAVARAIVTAAHWAAVLSRENASPFEAWTALFRATYAAELRVERGGRADTIVNASPERWAALPPPALVAAERQRGRRAWTLRRAMSKPLNVLRLIKAAFTFKGGADYLAWKIERHTGVPVPLTEWQRRHPVLAAPGVLLKLRRAGALR